MADLLRARGCTEQHARDVCAQITALLALSGYSLDADTVMIAVGKFRAEKGRSARTANKYLRSLKQFTKWLSRPSKSLLARDPLVEIEMFNIKRDRRHERTAFSDEQLRTLLGKTRGSNYTYRGLCGADRAELYHAAAATGIREGTLGLLEVGQFNLDPKAPMGWVSVRAEQIKDAEDLVVPIQAESAAQLRRYFVGRMPTAKAFRVPEHKWDYIRMLRKDLIGAGIQYCRPIVLAGAGRVRRMEVLDFHALRHTYGSWLAKSGVPLTTAQKWMGHSDPSLTANIYSHVIPPDALAAMLRLPPLPGVVSVG